MSNLARSDQGFHDVIRNVIKGGKVQLFGEKDMSGPSMPQSDQPMINYGRTTRRNAGLYASAGALCAIIGAFIFPEILCSAGIILGGYVWKLDCNENKNRGLVVMIIGIVAMLIGLYYVAFITVGDFLP